jgi:hypothetical protein
MDLEYLLPSAVLSTVGTMYTIFIAVIAFSVKYLDKSLTSMDKLRFSFILLSIIVLGTMLFNGYVLYLQVVGVMETVLLFNQKIFFIGLGSLFYFQ